MTDNLLVISDKDYKGILLGIMDAIDSYCRENEIQYYMVGGTLLGAVRHKGFIPWDDDIDIAMKREDYELFCRDFNENRIDNYRLVGLNNTKQYYTSFAKVIDTRTTLIENSYQAIEIGAYIDVFPLDYISKENYDNAIRLLNRDSLIDKIKAVKTTNISHERSFIKNTAIILSRALCWSSINKIALEYESRAKKMSGNSSDPFIANLHGAWGIREIVDSKCFDSSVELQFEGRHYLAPSGYDSYLQNVYGDYMKLPPLEKRVTHHDYKVYWKS